MMPYMVIYFVILPVDGRSDDLYSVTENDLWLRTGNQFGEEGGTVGTGVRHSQSIVLYVHPVVATATGVYRLRTAS
jgi:hypothetical protein